jgi:PAS domain S-box-containing protein
LNTGQTPPYEKQMFRKDGSRWWGLFAPTRISGSGLNSECVEFIIDITERKRIEEELLESREMFAAAFSTVQDALIISDMETGLIIDVNQTWTSHWGYSKEESLGHRSTEMGVFTDIDDRKRALEIIRKEGRLSDFEIQIRTKSGELRNVVLFVEQLMLPQKSLMLTIIHDITEHKRALSALHSRTEELQFANSELKSFSYSVSHDLRSPITVIKGFSNILLEDYGDKFDEYGKNVLNHIITGTNKMSSIIESLLSLSRISRETMICQEIDLGTIAETVISELRQNEPERAVQVNIANTIPAHADPKLITITLTNLIGNAWKYTGKNKDARIDVGITIDGDENVYFIRDNGAGFDMDYADKLFKPFQRLHKESEFTGTGIGLAIVQRIIQRHGGRIWAESQADLGSTFYFTLNCRV